MASKILLKPFGTRSILRFIQDELPSLQQSPILLVASEPAEVSLPALAESCKWVQFTLSQRFGLRTVQATISSAFGSVQDSASRQDLLRRTGASSIVAVGSGAAMDVGKNLARHHHHVEQLILVPSTYAAVMAAGASHSLLLDTIEETLVPSPRGVDPMPCPVNVAPLDANYMVGVEPNLITNACLAIALDACLRKSNHPMLDDLLHDLHQLCHNEEMEPSHDTIVNLSFRAGNLISYGLGSEDRSAPLALASSLIPRLFPHVHILEFWAGLLPGLCHVLEQSALGNSGVALEIAAAARKREVSQLAVMDQSLEGFSVPDMALSHIQANSTVWKSFDLPNQVLTDILQKSLGELPTMDDK